MIVAHLADLHLGHRAYARSRAGRNLRERDVAEAFRAAIQEILRVEPDLVLVAGDVFDRPEPPPRALVTLARGLATLRASLPGTPVLAAAGARDTLRSWGDPAALAAFDTLPGVEAATGTARSVRLRGGELHVLLLPHRSVLRRPRPELRPDPEARWNVLVAHGRATTSGRAGPVPTGPAVRTSDWDYVALGHEHRHRIVSPRVVFAGSLERVDPEPWADAHRPGGFVVADLEAGTVELREVPGRPVVALAPVRWDPERPERMNERIREVSREVPGGLDGKIVRLRLENLDPGRLGELDGELLAALRERAMHLAIEVRLPPASRTPRPTLLERVERRLDAGAADVDALRRAADRVLDGGADRLPDGEGMKLDSVGVSGAPGLGTLELRPGRGLVGWVGGTLRDRRVLFDLLLRSLGLADAGDRSPDDGRAGPSPVSTGAVVDVAGARLELRDGAGGKDGRPGGVARALGLTPRELALVWAGRAGGPAPDDLLGEAQRLLARLRGLDRLDAALDRLGTPPDERADPTGGEERERLEAELAEIESQLRTLAGVPKRLEALEASLRDLRGEAAEVAGELEAANEEWLRERQDAATHLQACRDRARELRSRLRRMEEGGRDADCPFCGRPLDDRHGEVLDGLRDEWERLVQDGRWWRRRREQLGEKPAGLRELEDRSRRLRAQVEERSERLERCRLALRRRDELRGRRRDLLEELGDGARRGRSRSGPDATDRTRSPPGVTESERRRRLRHALSAARRELLDEAADDLARRSGAYLNRMSGGRILGVVRAAEGRPLPVEDARPVSSPGEEDRIALTVALRLAVGVEVVEAGVPLGSLLLGEPFRILDVETRLRTVELLRSLRERLPQLLLLSGDEVVEAAPERFERIFEFADDRRSGRPTLRSLPGGVGTLHLDEA